MNAKKLVKGKMYRQKVNSKQGYEDWKYTNHMIKTPDGVWYAFENDLGVYYFDNKDIKDFEEI